MQTILGEREYVLGLAFDAYPDGPELAYIISEGIRCAGMTPYREPVIEQFPIPPGLGGEGELHYQGISAPVEIFQMLTESGIMGNTYVFRDRHKRLQKKTRILLASCLEINIREYSIGLSKHLGPVMEEGFFVY